MFDGVTYDKQADGSRISRQLDVVRDCIQAGEWWSLAGIASHTGYPEASISARLRDLRKDKFGGYRIDRRRSGDRGLWEYRLIPHETKQGELFEGREPFRTYPSY